MKTIWTIIKFTLIWLIVGAVIVMGSYFIFNDLLLGFKILIGVFVAWLILYIIYRVVKRILAKRRVKQLVNIERGEGSGEEDENWFPIREFFTEDRTLYRRIAKILRYLRTSRLSVFSDAVAYAKPWFLVMGEENSGAGELFENSDIPFPITGAEALKAPDGMIDFYLANEAVYINLSHELLPGHGSKIPQQLVQLLKAMLHERSKEPINSVVLTINVQTLIEGDEEEKRKLAEKHRFYLNFFMLYFRMPLPVHLMVTGCEDLEGFNEWTRLLSEEHVYDALGDVNADQKPVDTFLTRAILATRGRVERLISLALSAQKPFSPRALELSSSLSDLESYIKQYVDILFVKNEYQESPEFAGLYFSGKRPRGNPTDEEIALNPDLPKLSCFARGFLTEILPEDRERIHELGHYRKRGYSIPTFYYLGINAGAGVVFAFSVWYFSVHPTGNLVAYMRDYNDRVAGAQLLSYKADNPVEPLATDPSDLIRSTVTMDYVRLMVSAFGKIEEGWWLPWQSLVGKGDFSSVARNKYYTYLSTNLVSRVDQSLAQHFKEDFSAARKLRLSQEEVDSQIAQYAGLLYQRIYILDQYQRGVSQPALEQLDPPFQESPLYFRDAIGYSRDNLNALNKAYVQALYWAKLPDGTPSPLVETEMNNLNELLTKVLDQGVVNLDWIVGWADQALRLEEVNIEDQFLGSASVEPPLKVGGAYTLAGEQLVDDFLVRMLALYQEGDPVYARIIEFRQNYIRNYIQAWANFATDSARGLERLKTRPEWFATIQQLSGDKNPFFNIIDIMSSQTAPLLNADLLQASRGRLLANEIRAKDEANGQKADPDKLQKEVEDALSDPEFETPEWATLIDFYESMKKVGQESTKGGANPALQKAVTKIALKTVGKAGKAGKALAKTAKKVQKDLKKANKGNKKSTARTADELQQNIEKAAGELDNYIVAMRDLAFQAETRASIYGELKGVFQNYADVSKAPGSLGKMNASLKNLQFSMGIESPLNRPFWSLMRGSIYTIERFAAQESAEEIQSLWEKKILAQTAGLEGNKFTDSMFNEGSGLLWKFVGDDVQPFFDTTNAGTMVPRQLDEGIQIPFTDAYVRYLTKAKLALTRNRPSYSVVLEGDPTSVNNESLFKPTRTIISMDCGAQSYNLINLNFHTRDVIEWRPDCGDMTLTIDFTVFSIEKVFKAPDGFARFLGLFQGGAAQLKARDFPESAGNLRDISASDITLRYVVSGADDLIASVDAYPKTNPQIIVKRWQDLAVADDNQDSFSNTGDQSLGVPVMQPPSGGGATGGTASDRSATNGAGESRAPSAPEPAPGPAAPTPPAASADASPSQ